MTGQLGQAPEAAENASFLHKETTLKVRESGTVSLPGAGPSGGSNTSTVSVTLTGYPTAPAVLCFLPEYGNAGTTLPAFNWNTDGTFALIIVSSVVQSGNNYILTFTTRNFAGFSDEASTYIIKYYVFFEDAA